MKKRIYSVFLTLALIVGLFSAISLTASAVDTYDGLRIIPSVNVGYTSTSSAALTRINNSSPDRPTVDASVSLSGGNAQAFTLSSNYCPPLDYGETYTIYVTPVIGLGPGTYTTTVIISHNNGTGNRAIYDISFTVLNNTYTVTFVDWNGAVLKTQTVTQGGNATPPSPSPSRVGYTFTGWSGSYTNVTSNRTITAQYVINTYTIRFLDWNGAILNTQTVNHGGTAPTPPNPTRTGYTFTGWDKAVSNVTQNMDVYAQYTINYYDVTFIDWDGGVLSEQSIAYLHAAEAPDAPERVGYTFIGWDADFGEITSPLTVTALYEINYYDVTFIDWDGVILSEQSIAYLHAAEAPADPSRYGYIFLGWDEDFSSITGPLTVTALYKPIEIRSAVVTSYGKNLQDKNNNNLKFSVLVTMTDGSTYTVEHTESVKGGQKGNKTFTYNCFYSKINGNKYTVYVAWNDNNTVTTCEVRAFGG